MNVLFLTTHLNTGGITTYLDLLTQGYCRQGHLVVVASSGGNRQSVFEQYGARHVRLDLNTKCEVHPKVFFALDRLQDVIKKENIHIIHAQTRVTQVLGSLLRRITGRPYLSTCHGFFRPRMFRRLFPCWGQTVIAISPAVADHLKADFRLPKEQVVLIKNGVDLDAFSPVGREIVQCRRKEKGWPAGPVIGIIARLSEVKGHEVLIRAFFDIISEFPQARLMIVGQGKEETVLKALVRELSLEAQVVFIPDVDRSAELMPLFDVFVMPSRQEGLGLSILEAQAAGLPVVASNVGGIPALIDNGKTGFLVTPEDPRELAAAVKALLRDPQKARAIGMQSRIFVENEYPASRMTEQTLELYQRLLQKAGRG